MITMEEGPLKPVGRTTSATAVRKKKVATGSPEKPDPQGKRHGSGEGDGQWIGFGAAAPPKRKSPKSKNRHDKSSSTNRATLPPKLIASSAPPSSKKEKTVSPPMKSDESKDNNTQIVQVDSDDASPLLKDAEKLIQLLLGNDGERLTKESLERAMRQAHFGGVAQNKNRYSTLLERPWRTSITSSEQRSASNREEDALRISEMKSKNPQSFRRASTPNLAAASAGQRNVSLERFRAALSDEEENSVHSANSSFKASGRLVELAQTQNRLNHANAQIALLKKQLATMQQQQNRMSSSHDSFPSFAEDSGRGGVDVCNNTSGSVDNRSGGTENDPQKIIQMLQTKILTLEIDLDKEIQSRESEESYIVQENKALLAKLESTEKSLAIEEKFKEQKRVQAHENQLRINELEKRVADYEEKLTQQESRQCEQVQSLLDQISKSEQDLSDIKIQHRKDMEDALAKQGLELRQKFEESESQRSKEMQFKIAAFEEQVSKSQKDILEQQNEQAAEVQVLLEKLAKADAKLEEQGKALRVAHTNFDSSEIKSTIVVLEKQLDESKKKLAEQEERHCVEMQALLEQQALQQSATESQRSSEQQLSQLRHELVAAKESTRQARQRLADLEQAQAREQEVLCRDLRESENTIAGLMDEVNALRPLPLELDRTQKELAKTRYDLEKANEKIDELAANTREMLESLQQSRLNEASLREEVELMAPLALDLERAEEALDITRANLAQMEERVNELKRKKGDEETTKKLKADYEAQLAELEDLHEELSSTYEENKKAHQKIAERDREHKAEIELQVKQLKDATERIAVLELELESVRAQTDRMEKSMRTTHEDVVIGLKNILKQKEKDIESLHAEVAGQQKQITSGRLQIEEMGKEFQYAQSKIQELSSILEAHRNSESEEKIMLQRLEQQTDECVMLAAERDTMKQKVNVLETKVTLLETDNKKKKQLVQELMSSANNSSSNQALLENLQNEQERTLERCTDLSLQLAESQFKVDELTQMLRQVQRSNSMRLPRPEVPRAQHSFSVPAMLANGIGRNSFTTTTSTTEDVSSSGDQLNRETSVRALFARGSSYMLNKGGS